LHLVTFERREGRETRDATEREDDGQLRELATLGLDLSQSASAGARRVGALLPPGPHGGDVVDLNRALAVLHALEDVGAPEAQADSLLPGDPLAFLRQLARALPAAQRALEFVAEASERYDAPDLLRAGVVLPRRTVRLAAPIPRPGKILAVARNYAAHAAELGAAAAPPEPVLFLKAPSSVIGPEDEIVLPKHSQAVDYEGELAVVIGRVARHLAEETALECVAGYTVANDVSARDYQNVRGQHFIGKSCDTFTPLGPSLVTQDEIPDPHDLSIRTALSGELVQLARTKEMIFPIARILTFASRLMTLEPGDILLTGTPAGVGMARNPPRYLREGDVVDVEIERIGRLRSFVTLERN
jgi:2-keto-4-pentenoate hydratase/2-oxohepta-3-ene-1,7-dioic acid hydratase in catechol pathway